VEAEVSRVMFSIPFDYFSNSLPMCRGQVPLPNPFSPILYSRIRSFNTQFLETLGGGILVTNGENKLTPPH
jgi:hypothetical protein